MALAGSAAAQTLTIGLGSVAGPEWSARAVAIEIHLERNVRTATITAAQVEIPPLGEFTHLVGHCAQLHLSGHRVRCDDAVVTADSPTLGKQRLRASFNYDAGREALNFSVNGARLARGTVRAKGQWTTAAWNIDLLARGLSLRVVAALLNKHLALPPKTTLSGTASARARLQGDATGPNRLTANLDLRDLTLETPSGNLATSKLGADGRLQLDKAGNGWRLALESSASHGQAYADPVFMDLAQNPIQFEAQGIWRPGDKLLDVTAATFHQKNVLLAHGAGEIRVGTRIAVPDLRIRLNEARLASLYRLYLQPFLIGTALDSLHIDGNATGNLDLAGGYPSRVTLRFTTTKVADTKGRFDFKGLSGNVIWVRSIAAGKRPPASTIGWRRAAAYRIPLGAVSFSSELHGRDFQLSGPIHVPVLDGALDIGKFSVSGIGQPNMAIVFDGRLSKIGLTALCGALGWPPFSGTLSGRLPTLTYRAGVLTLGGDLQARVFDGRIAVENLRAVQPFGAVPEVSATVKIRNLNLKPLTEAFSFGTIEGRMDGEVDHLRLVNWEPAAFDAHFYTAPGDKSRHRISQRAIENISNLGGGPTGALSRGFLRFFKTFSYDRMGLSCKLQENVCVMNGLQPTTNGGYYIVKGAGLPRVDVVGFAHEVSWSRLVEQLKAAIHSGSPQVK